MAVRMARRAAQARTVRHRLALPRAPALQWLAYALLTVWGALFLFPLYWMFTTALKPGTVTIQLPPQLIPNPLTLDNFLSLVGRGPVFRWAFNSAFVAVMVTVFNTFLSALAGYTLAKKRFPGDFLIFWLIVSLMMVPWQLMLVPLFVMMRTLGWMNTYWALIVPDLVSPFGIFLLRQYLSTLPSELIDAGKIDGAGEFGIFWRIVLPIAVPGLVVVAIFTFSGSWNMFFWPLLVTESDLMRTLQVGIAQLQHRFYTDYGLLMAGASFAATPMIVVFLAFQHYFLRGITIGALKG